MWSWFQYLGSAFLGWSLGANDSANVFGTAVSSKMVNYKLAVVLISVFVCLGALLQGERGIKTISGELRNTPAKSESVQKKDSSSSSLPKEAIVASFAAAFTVTIMTVLAIPVSTSQAVVGAIIGIGLVRQDVNFGGLGKVVACWIGTPIGGCLLTIFFYYLFRGLFRKARFSVFQYDPIMSVLLILCGCYGAYALGANNVANVSAVFVRSGALTVRQAIIFGAITISIGAMTYSKPVMATVGKGLIKLDSFCAFVCVLSHAVTVHIYAIIGVPVSTSQAIVGAILGIGFIKGAQTVNYRTLMNIGAGWLSTPIIAGIFSALFYLASSLRFVPTW